MITLTWLPHWNAYAVRREGGRLIGLVRCTVSLPFRAVVEFVRDLGNRQEGAPRLKRRSAWMTWKPSSNRLIT